MGPILGHEVWSEALGAENLSNFVCSTRLPLKTRRICVKNSLRQKCGGRFYPRPPRGDASGVIDTESGCCSLCAVQCVCVLLCYREHTEYDMYVQNMAPMENHVRNAQMVCNVSLFVISDCNFLHDRISLYCGCRPLLTACILCM